MKNILWLSPNINHYKARFLNHLANVKGIKLTVLSGTGREGMGDQEMNGPYHFNHIKLNINKQNFGKSREVQTTLKKLFKNYNWILIPTEKKNLLLFIYALYLQKRYKGPKLFTYTHPISKSGKWKTTFLDKLITKFYYSKIDRAIFYTEQSCKWAIKNELIHPEKAFWANNTIDTLEVKKYYEFVLPSQGDPVILFIGRLIPSKRIDILMHYFKVLKADLPNLKLHIIGDGPQRDVIESAIAMQEDNNIIHYGTLIDEKKIAQVIRKSTVVFVPGHSGLSINHAFAYGRPYVTIQNPTHAPEICYLEDGKNGYILNGARNENTDKLLKLLTNKELLTTFCENAKASGEALSIEHWVKQIKWSLLHE